MRHAHAYACVAAGGTGGHIVPGIAIARELVVRGHDPESILFVGSEAGIDSTLVPAAGFPLVLLPGRGIERRFSPAAALAILSILRGVLKGVGVLARARPKVVIVLGGYASVPCIVGAVLLRIPIIVVARDARGGLADRLGARFAKACAVPFDGSDLPKAVVTGNPVRSEVLAIEPSRDRAVARAELGLGQKRTVIAVFTGSLGSRRVNDAVLGLVDRWSERDDLAVRHVIGSRDWELVNSSRRVGALDGIEYQAVKYEDRVDLLLAAADVVVSRAGGATIAELAVVGVPAILVPLPIAPRDHQSANAAVLVRAGGAVAVPDNEFDTDRLELEITPLIEDLDLRRSMARRSRSVGRRDAAARVVDLVEEHARNV